MKRVKLNSGDALVLVLVLHCGFKTCSSALQFLLHLLYGESKPEESIDKIFVSLGGWLAEFFNRRQGSTCSNICSGKLALPCRVGRLESFSRWSDYVLILRSVHQVLDGIDIGQFRTDLCFEVDTAAGGVQRLQ